jgi:hypothetical protein
MHAEQSAARKYLHNNFRSVENSLQAENEVPSQKKKNPPKKFRRKEWRNSMQKRRKKVRQEVEMKEKL